MKCLNRIVFKKQGKLYNLPCGKCIACQSNKSLDWQFRLQMELKSNNYSAVFLTLTYSEDCLPTMNGTPILNKEHLQLFFRYLRRTGLPVRYFAVGEYGGLFQRPHYHAILFGVDFNNENYEKIQKIWKHGFIQMSQVTNGRICYITKYMFKFLRADAPLVKEFQLSSKRPYLGYGYCSDPSVQRWHLDYLRNYAQIENGIKLPLPRIIREKLFSPQELEVISIKADNYNRQRGQEEFREMLQDESGDKYFNYIFQDKLELERQQQVLERLKYKEQLKKENYEYFQKLKTQKSKEE